MEKIKVFKPFRNNITGQTAIISDMRAAGMCNRTIGMTIVIYKYHEDKNKFDYSFIMETSEFHKTHTVI